KSPSAVVLTGTCMPATGRLKSAKVALSLAMVAWSEPSAAVVSNPQPEAARPLTVLLPILMLPLVSWVANGVPPLVGQDAASADFAPATAGHASAPRASGAMTMIRRARILRLLHDDDTVDRGAGRGPGCHRRREVTPR